MATASEINEIIKLYVGYYNRAPDALGLNFWINAFDGGFSLADMAVDFSTQPETRANYPFFDPAQKPNPTLEDLGVFIDTVYQNLFNRSPDEAGKDFWAGKINSGEFTVGQAISLIIEGAAAPPPAGASQDFINQQQADKAVVDNKVAAGLDFYTDLNAAPGGSTYVFTPADVTAATDIQKNVTADPASLASAAAATDAYIANSFGGTATGVNINLTTSTDQPGGGGGGVDTQGTSADDTYSATVESNNGGSLQSADNIAAGEGTDTLTVRVISLTGTQTVAPVASGLENIVINNQAASGDFRLNFVDISGETEVTAARNNVSTTTRFINLDTGTKVRVVDNDGIATAHFKGDRSGSTNDKVELYVENSGTSDTSVNFATLNENSSAIDESFEIAEIETGGTTESFFNAPGMTLDSILVTGNQRLNLEDTTNNFETLESIDASGMTAGGLNLNAEDNTVSSFSFMGSGQADMVELNRTLFNNANTLSLDGGDGIDTLIVEGFNNLNASSVNQADNFEILQSSGATSSLDASEFSKIDTFVFDGQTSNGNRLNITNLSGDDRFVFTSDQGQGDETVRFAAENAGTKLTFELRASSETDGEIRIVTDTNSGNDNAAIGFGNSNVNFVEIISSGSNTNANVIRAVDNGFNHYAFDNQNGPSSFEISGSQALIITAEVGVNLNASSDERGFHSAVNLNGSNATGDLRIAGSGSADVIQGGQEMISFTAWAEITF
ncbi:DUF4214 domain-containing protein [Sulfitobacter sediminilitoris]|uniref:DUF4214 domain-containing protein n=1 Tax=Sulfitobacter sediminilitoris TaxID=2698830 RepID=UPI0036111441